MKVLFVGNQGSGKSTVLRELTGIPSIERTTKPTQGCHVVKCSIDDKAVEIWDVSGDPKYLPFRTSYFSKANVCILFGEECTWRQEVLAVSPNALCHVYMDTDTLKTFLQKNG